MAADSFSRPPLTRDPACISEPQRSAREPLQSCRKLAPKLRVELNQEDIRKAIASVEAAIADIRSGKMVILVDDADRENEGDLCIAAEKVTPEAINFMARFGRGLVCLSLTEETLKKLNLSMMVPDHENTSGFGTAFTISIEARHGVTTGHIRVRPGDDGACRDCR